MGYPARTRLPAVSIRGGGRRLSVGLKATLRRRGAPLRPEQRTRGPGTSNEKGLILEVRLFSSPGPRNPKAAPCSGG